MSSETTTGELPRFTIGPVANKLARTIAGDEPVNRKHLDQAIADLKTRLETAEAVSGSEATPTDEIAQDHRKEIASLAAAVGVLSAELMHLRYMLVAIHQPEDEGVVMEIDRANDAFVKRTQAQLTALGIPEQKRESALEQLQMRLEMQRGSQEIEHEEER